MSHGEIEAQHRKSMNDIAEILDSIFQGYGFALLIFSLNKSDGRMNYISNAMREDMLVAMKEFIAHSEGRALEAPTMKQ
jgi:hypothetical protein